MIPVLEMTGVGKTYRRGDEQVNVLVDVDFTLNAGEFVVVTGGDGGCAHVGVDLGFACAADAHGVEAVLEVVDVGGDNHAAGGDFVADLGGGEVGLALGDSRHLGRDDAEARVLELGDGGEGGGWGYFAGEAAGVGEDVAVAAGAGG